MLQVFYYADRIFLSAGVETDHVQYVTVSIGAINVLMTLLAVSFFWGSLSLSGFGCLVSRLLCAPLLPCSAPLQLSGAGYQQRSAWLFAVPESLPTHNTLANGGDFTAFLNSQILP